MKDKKAGSRRAVKIILIVAAVVIVLSALTASLDPAALAKKWFGKKDTGGDEEQIEFYPVDENLNILTDEGYLALDHRLFWNDSITGESYSIEEDDLSTSSDIQRFFYDYFDALIRGDTGSYPSFFSEECRDYLPTDFTMQMIYDIEVRTETWEDDEEQQFEVSYRIHRNNGTFRRDVGSDICRPLRFCVRFDNGRYKITSISAYYFAK